MTYREYLQTLPQLTGNRPDGTPIEDHTENAINERGHFFTLTRAATETERIEGMLPEGAVVVGPTPTPDNYGYRLKGDSAKLKRYDIIIDGRSYDLGTIVGFVSTYPGFPAAVSEYGMTGDLEVTATPAPNTTDIFLKFTPAPEVKPPQVAPADVPPFPAPAGQEWVRGMMGWALVPKNASGYTEAQINDILNRVSKALRG
jgi:hypothetical protein